MRTYALVFATLCTVLAGCGGGGKSSPPVPVTHTQAKPAGTTTLSIVIPRGQRHAVAPAQIYSPALPHGKHGVVKLVAHSYHPSSAHSRKAAGSTHTRKPQFVDGTPTGVLNITSQSVDPVTGIVLASTPVQQVSLGGSTTANVTIPIYAGSGIVVVTEVDTANNNAVLAKGQASYNFSPGGIAVALDIALSIVPGGLDFQVPTGDGLGGPIPASVDSPTVNISSDNCGYGSAAGQTAPFSVTAIDADNTLPSGDGALPSVSLITSPVNVGGTMINTFSDNLGSSTINPVPGVPNSFTLNYDGLGNGVNAAFRVVDGFNNVSFVTANLGDTCLPPSPPVQPTLAVEIDNGDDPNFSFDSGTNTLIFVDAFDGEADFMIEESPPGALITLDDGGSCGGAVSFPTSVAFNGDDYPDIAISPNGFATPAGCALNISDGFNTITFSITVPSGPA